MGLAGDLVAVLADRDPGEVADYAFYVLAVVADFGELGGFDFDEGGVAHFA